MKKFVMRHLMINCRDATLLTAKKEEGKLGFVENIQLRIHISMCSFCKRFEKQARTIASESKGVSAEGELSESAKQRIRDILNGYSSKES